ncbi:hypothetical protein T7377_09665 [Bradyrhizobium diazoefficiens]|uniref:hypothetical protein n=1 Tax=Bradyrhizobium diazoefficiens TaxID=1355477 RepID=UPI002B484F30|nr:hypothetical protein [Bradyrhizobium diazoefficiens]WRJ25192.1 hypothetical protein T7377_09665 [Bradyrhizobium diazoefficiens]
MAIDASASATTTVLAAGDLLRRLLFSLGLLGQCHALERARRPRQAMAQLPHAFHEAVDFLRGRHDACDAFAIEGETIGKRLLADGVHRAQRAAIDQALDRLEALRGGLRQRVIMALQLGGCEQINDLKAVERASDFISIAGRYLRIRKDGFDRTRLIFHHGTRPADLRPQGQHLVEGVGIGAIGLEQLLDGLLPAQGGGLGLGRGNGSFQPSPRLLGRRFRLPGASHGEITRVALIGGQGTVDLARVVGL